MDTDYLTNINVFMIYYNKRYSRAKNINIFTGVNIDDEMSTTKCMEVLYEHIYRYKCADEDEKKLYNREEYDEINIDSCEELYVLVTNNEYNIVSQTLMPIISYVATTDWVNSNWNIYQLKNRDEN